MQVLVEIFIIGAVICISMLVICYAFIAFPADDKRLRKILMEKSIPATHRFPSPIKIWLAFFVICWSTLTFVLLWHTIILVWLLVIIPYTVLAYLLAAYVNTSFALNQEAFIVVNTNFPFKRIHHFKFKDISRLVINKEPAFFFAFPIGIFGGNYLEIQIHGKIERFYCVGLDLDAYDENFTRQTLNDLERALDDQVAVSNYLQ